MCFPTATSFPVRFCLSSTAIVAMVLPALTTCQFQKQVKPSFKLLPQSSADLRND